MVKIQEAFNGLIEAIIAILPTSPFAEFISEFASLPFLGYLNWFFPVHECLVVMTAWLGAIALFYVYSIVMRWVKMIGD